MNHDLETRLDVLRQVTAEVAAFALTRSHNLAQIAIETKGKADYVSAVDRDAESLARSLIHAKFPADAIVGEEQPGDAQGDHWLIDPVDGSANFLSGIPFWAVSIAYVRDNEPVLGAVALPALDAALWASGEGPVHGTGSVSLLVGTQPVAFGIGRNRTWPIAHRLEVEATLEAQGLHIVCLGSCAAALAMVAAGRLAGYIEHGTNVWDCAAGHVLCRAANVPSAILPETNGKVAVIAASGALTEVSKAQLSLPERPRQFG
ncbi:inositol monophosphatase family protein [Sinorhizobium sp. 7-81]|uniref:inositol monophosphatase family protein n=1 Tax=unclassified Sinorhizobium TaxID=2613772 RepID=UPI0024C3D44C|nr:MULTISPECIES: inositol monophosphatase family protein [unclassified Sinorhizobium]MDK1389932.1 inositol monophosphatase family protein [Sinorhizobium sp. 7-81]MDK1494548.1 inositol monophosphatase family protein [Sinorhizobium sp. 8-89]